MVVISHPMLQRSVWMFKSGWRWQRGIKMVPSFPLLSCELSVSVKTLIQEKFILRERMVVVVKMEYMLRYNHLQWYGNVIYWHSNSQTSMRIHGARSWWKKEESSSCELSVKKDWKRWRVQIKQTLPIFVWRDKSIKTDVVVIVGLMFKVDNGIVILYPTDMISKPYLAWILRSLAARSRVNKLKFA